MNEQDDGVTEDLVKVYMVLVDTIQKIDAIGHQGYADLLRQYSEPIWLAMSEEQQDSVIEEHAKPSRSFESLVAMTEYHSVFKAGGPTYQRNEISSYATVAAGQQSREHRT